MAITTLDTSGASGAGSDGQLHSLTAVWDYDSVAKTVGVTATGDGSQYLAALTTSKGSFGPWNLVNWQFGSILNTGRQIILGPGSIIGNIAPVAQLPTGVVVTWTWSSP